MLIHNLNTMEDKLILTYSLLAHIKEASNHDHNSIEEVFIPIVKKGLSEYSKTKDLEEIKGSNLNEIQTKIFEVFGLKIPMPILLTIMQNIDKQINDSNIFNFYDDNAFIIKRFVFDDLEDLIATEESNISKLEVDYKNYCKQLREIEEAMYKNLVMLNVGFFIILSTNIIILKVNVYILDFQ